MASSGSSLPRIRKAMVLAAGFGTRLRPLTENLPKPLVPLLDRPMLEYSLRWVRQWGVREVMLNAHHVPEGIVEFCEQWSDPELTLHYNIEEDEILGTAGGLGAVADFFRGEDVFLMVNGDILTDVDISVALAEHTEHGALATLLAIRRPHSSAEIVADTAGRLVKLADYLPGSEDDLRSSGPGGTFTGIHLMSRDILSFLPTTPAGINRQVYPVLHEEGELLRVCFVDGYWRDIGTLPSYLRANWELAAGGGPAPERRSGERLEPGAARFVGAEVELGSDVEIGEKLVIGSNSRIGAGSRLNRAVVWAGSKLEPGCRLSNAVWMSDATCVDLDDTM